jgi:hypothetical protein
MHSPLQTKLQPSCMRKEWPIWHRSLYERIEIKCGCQIMLTYNNNTEKVLAFVRNQSGVHSVIVDFFEDVVSDFYRHKQTD